MVLLESLPLKKEKYNENGIIIAITNVIAIIAQMGKSNLFINNYV
jgi:hypothetical protein